MTIQPNDASPAPLIRWLRAAGHLIQAAILCYGLAITAYLLARTAVGERWNWIAFANNFIPWWALGNVVVSGIALFARRRWLLIGLQLPGIIAFVVLYGELLLPRETSAEATDPSRLTAATYNIISSVSDPQRVKEVIIGLDADVIGLQELGPDHAAILRDELSELYPYQALYPGLPVSGVGLLSRYPIVHDEMFQPLPGSMFFLRAVIDVDGVPVTVVVAHPPPPYHVVSPFSYDDTRRDAEITILLQDYLRHETGPLLVLGDFNMTDQTDSYQQMDDLLDDAYREAGRGLGFTFPDVVRWTSAGAFPLLLRIDYIWYNTHFTAHAVSVGDDGGTSDHRPVRAELSLDAARAD